MNFEFLQNLRGMEHIYTPCKDAEDLAVAKPYLSMTAARKSAEALANFIYLNAYREKALSLSFADILSDYNVKRYIGDRAVIDAFHNIRKSGNRAVHESVTPSPKQSLDILEDLMFVAGETAKKAKLIKGYPQFNANIVALPEAELHDFDVSTLAEKMFYSYIAKDRAERIYAAYKKLCNPVKLMDETIVLHESLEIVKKPDDPAFIPTLQEYFGTLALNAIQSINELTKAGETVSFFPSLTIYGNEPISTNDLYEFMELLYEKVPNSERFVLDCCYEGPDSDFLYSGEKLKLEVLAAENESPIKMYKYNRFDYNGCEVKLCMYENGAQKMLTEQPSPRILDDDYGEIWWSVDIGLVVDMDNSSHDAIIEQLHSIVRKHVPDNQIKYCENAWSNGEPENLLNGIQWNPRHLREVQNFFDELNKILLPLKDEIDCSCVGEWIIPKSAFAKATWDWFEDGFKIVGCVY